MSSQNIKILLLVVLVGGITLFYLSTKQSSTPIANTNENNSVAETKIDTATWATYEDKEKGFKFKHPTELEVLNGKDLNFPENENDAIIILPTKYPNIKIDDPKNPETFQNYTIGIYSMSEKPEFYGSSTDEIIKNISGSANNLKQISSTNNAIVFSNSVGYSAYYIDNNVIYNFWLDGDNPEDIATQDWLKSINNPQLTEWVSNYPEYLKIFEGIYSTFEITK